MWCIRRQKDQQFFQYFFFVAFQFREFINGDHILAICAIHMKIKKQLRHDTLVVTQMSNFGLEKKMNEHGIKVITTNVGDKNVVDEMRRGSYSLGGEQSGHIILSDYATSPRALEQNRIAANPAEILFFARMHQNRSFESQCR